MNNESYVEGLRYELAGAVQRGDKDHEKAIKTELDRVSGKKVEKAVRPTLPETRTKKAAAPKKAVAPKKASAATRSK